MMGLYRGLAGAVDVEIISAGLDRTIDAILDSRIGLFSVSPVDELTVRATVRRDALPMLTSLLSGRGEVLRVCGKRGIYWKLRGLIKRPVLMIGAMFLLFLTLG